MRNPHGCVSHTGRRCRKCPDGAYPGAYLRNCRARQHAGRRNRSSSYGQAREASNVAIVAADGRSEKLHTGPTFVVAVQ